MLLLFKWLLFFLGNHATFRDLTVVLIVNIGQDLVAVKSISPFPATVNPMCMSLN